MFSRLCLELPGLCLELSRLLLKPYWRKRRILRRRKELEFRGSEQSEAIPARGQGQQQSLQPLSGSFTSSS